MQTLRLLLLTLAVSITVGCFGPDPAMKAALDQKAAQLPSSSAVHAPPKEATPMPLQVGQWVQTKTVDRDGAVSLVTISLVDQEGDAFWQETLIETYRGRMVLRALIEFGDLADPNARRILRIQMKDDKGRVGEYPPSAVNFMQALGPSVDIAAWKTMPQDDVQVLAGRFTGCYKGPMIAKTLIGSIDGMSWWHPAVPINGIVKTIVTGGMVAGTSELVAFGLKGAKSDF